MRPMFSSLSMNSAEAMDVLAVNARTPGLLRFHGGIAAGLSREVGAGLVHRRHGLVQRGAALEQLLEDPAGHPHVPCDQRVDDVLQQRVLAEHRSGCDDHATYPRAAELEYLLEIALLLLFLLLGLLEELEAH